MTIPGTRHRRWHMWALYAALSVVFCAPLFAHPLALGAMDWDQHLFYYGAFLRNVVDYTQIDRKSVV